MARHFHKHHALASCCLLLVPACARIFAWSVDTAWVRLYSGVTINSLNRAADIEVGPDGNVYVCGGGEDEWPMNSDMLVAVYRQDGTFLDSKAVGG